MSKLRGVVLGALIAGGSVYAMKGCLSKQSPDRKVGASFEKVCSIAKRNVETPERGVRELGRYFSSHLGDLTGAWGDTIAMIESIPDDARHDERAREARKTMFEPLHACQTELLEFAQAVSEDEHATELMNHAGERLGRTIDIIFGSNVVDNRGHVDVRALEHALEAL
ncbi:MAG TPA: hypothetical protein VFQ65_29660 [Kofleriaceae bacterium]|nr:hypothetical protein [Kofleriaceae bacterium]